MRPWWLKVVYSICWLLRKLKFNSSFLWILFSVVCAEIPMGWSGSMDLCVADNASAAMPRKLVSSRQVNFVLSSFIWCHIHTQIYLLHSLNFELSHLCSTAKKLIIPRRENGLNLHWRRFPMFCFCLLSMEYEMIVRRRFWHFCSEHLKFLNWASWDYFDIYSFHYYFSVLKPVWCAWCLVSLGFGGFRLYGIVNQFVIVVKIITR